MFQKPFKVKSNTQLKGSERKKIRLEIQKNFPQLSDDDLQLVFPQKDPITAMKIWTHSNEQVMVYCTPNIPIVFEVEKTMYPTVYFLWKFPELLYTFTTWEPVISKLISGADLMLPGVVVKEPYTIKSFGKLEKGERVSVNISTNKAPFAVGKTALSSIDMFMSAKRGKGVQILHTVGDHLWFQSQRPMVPELGTPVEFQTVDAMESENKEVEEPQEKKSELLSEEEEEGEEKEGAASQEESVDDEEEDEEGAAADVDQADEDIEEHEEEPALSETDLQNFSDMNLDENKSNNPEQQEEQLEENPPRSMDDLLRYCFLKALRSPAAKKITFPLLTSNFFRLHMIPACPSNQSIDVKKSSFKKLSAFLAAMAQEDIVKIKEQVKGVETIVEVNNNHIAIKTFTYWPDDVPEKKEEGTKPPSKESPNIVELYKITAHVLPIFKSSKYKKGDGVTAPILRQFLTDYVKANNLQDPTNPRFVVLDAALQDGLASKYGSGIVKLSWEELMQKVLSMMTMTYHLTATGPTPPAPAKGKLEPIDIRVSMRSGNKKVTLINNLELFGIVCQDFARKCQHGVAASTSISAVPGKKSAQVLVQGNQVDFVGKLLMGEYKIPVRYIRGLENAPAKKKNKGKK